MYLNKWMAPGEARQHGLTVTWDVFELAIKESFGTSLDCLTVTWDVFEFKSFLGAQISNPPFNRNMRCI